VGTIREAEEYLTKVYC